MTFVGFQIRIFKHFYIVLKPSETCDFIRVSGYLLWRISFAWLYAGARCLDGKTY